MPVDSSSIHGLVCFLGFFCYHCQCHLLAFAILFFLVLVILVIRACRRFLLDVVVFDDHSVDFTKWSQRVDVFLGGLVVPASAST